MASRVGVNLRASAYLHQGDRKYMEDEFQVAYQRTHDKKDIEYAFFGIFDGHGGKEAAHYAKDNLMDNIVSQRLFWSENDDDILCAIKEGFLQTHMAMWKELDKWPRTASGWPSTSGTTASIAFIRRQKIYIGHVGDSGIVLGCEDDGNEWIGVPMTKDHKPESHMEMNRITECGGKVVAKSGVPRVVWNRPKSGHQGPVRRSTPMDEIPFLAVARSLGDLWSYNATNNQFVVSPEPDVYVVDIDINLHRCLVFGTDGLWNALSPSTAVNIAYNSEKNNEKHYLGVPMGCGKRRLWINPSRCIVIGALNRYQKVNIRADNTSAVTVYLDPPGRPKREVLLQQLSLKKGSQSKNYSKSLNKKLKEATVKVHVYNQTSNGDGNRGILCIKERMPEERPKENDQDPSSTHTGALHSSLSPDNMLSSISKSDNQENRDSGENATEENSNVSSACSECGCNSRSSPTHNHLNSTLSDSFCDTAPTKSNNGNVKSKQDAIQIPLVSSSTYVEGSDDDKEEAKNFHGKAEAAAADAASFLASTKRRTRSCVSLPSQVKSENKGSSGMASRGKALTSQPFQPDASNRILKSVNRASSCLKLDASPSSFVPSKRKRSREMEQEERSSKSLRVHTRSHTTSHKPMITRSQGKTQVKRKSK